MKKFINAKIYRNDDATEILVENGNFKEVGNNLPDCDDVIDLEGKLVIPPYVDSHLHLDYVFVAGDGLGDGSGDSKTGTLFEAINRWPEIKKNQTVEMVKERIYKGLYAEMEHGVQAIRTHIDVTDKNLIALKAALEVREEVKDKVDLQIVSFPQNGMMRFKGGEELVEEALKMGADCVGGIPHYELAREFGEKSIYKTVELAVKYDKMIDVHCDETDDIHSRFIELLNALVTMEDIGERTAASHACSFGSVNDTFAFRMMDLFKKSKINFISNPTENAYLQGRQDTYPKRRGLTRVKEFVDNDINVSFGQDSINDPWYPLGNGNLMNILDNGIHLAQNMSLPEIHTVLDLVTINGAKTLNITDDYGIEAGKPANFVVLNAPNAFEAVRTRADALASIRNGEYLFKRTINDDIELSL